jgi:DtxR family transcriptional regulator, Mn-dependent transcriptional regulator
MVSPTVEDYVRAIYEAQYDEGREWVTTSTLARVLRNAPASVTEMLKKLASSEPQLIVYERYRGARLTSAGEKLALEVLRNHRLAESLLTKVLGYSWDEVHEEAHRLEHAMSEELGNRIDHFLGQPATDPHGEPIPAQDGTIARAQDVRLTELEPGRMATIQRVSDHDPALLRYLAELRLTPGTHIEITAKGPFGGPLHVRVPSTHIAHALGQEVTNHVFVLIIKNDPEDEQRS